MSEIRIEIKELKSRLSEYLRQVKQVRSIIITDHGRPVARISPVEPVLEERLQDVQAAAVVAWNGRKLEAITPVAVNRSARQVSDVLIEIRG